MAMRVWRRLCALVQRRARERDLEEELRFHVEMQTVALLASSIPARRATRIDPVAALRAD